MTVPSQPFWKTCKPCHGKGILKNSHPDALPLNGYPTGRAYPDRIHGHSGEIVSDPDHSYCGKCFGTGMSQ